MGYEVGYATLQAQKGHFNRLKCLEFFWSKNYVNFASRFNSAECTLSHLVYLVVALNFFH